MSKRQYLSSMQIQEKYCTAMMKKKTKMLLIVGFRKLTNLSN